MIFLAWSLRNASYSSRVNSPMRALVGGRSSMATPSARASGVGVSRSVSSSPPSSQLRPCNRRLPERKPKPRDGPGLRGSAGRSHGVPSWTSMSKSASLASGLKARRADVALRTFPDPPPPPRRRPRPSLRPKAFVAVSTASMKSGVAPDFMMIPSSVTSAIAP